MNEQDNKLDGNAAAGLLDSVFPFEMTVAVTICAGCGDTAQVGALGAYQHAPGLVLRCPKCDLAMIRIVHGSGRYWLDLRGVRCLEIDESTARIPPVPDL